MDAVVLGKLADESHRIADNVSFFACHNLIIIFRRKARASREQWNKFQLPSVSRLAAYAAKLHIFSEIRRLVARNLSNPTDFIRLSQYVKEPQGRKNAK
jgi:hypothetical protein